MTQSASFPCPQCDIGYCSPSRATWVTLFEGRLLSMPDTPVYICDICGYREFDVPGVAARPASGEEGQLPAVQPGGENPGRHIKPRS